MVESESDSGCMVEEGGSRDSQRERERGWSCGRNGKLIKMETPDKPPFLGFYGCFVASMNFYFLNIWHGDAVQQDLYLFQGQKKKRILCKGIYGLFAAQI